MHLIARTLILGLLLTAGTARADGSPEDISLCRQGWDRTQSGAYDQATELYLACIKSGHLTDASLSRTYRNLGLTHRMKGEARVALGYYNQALALKPADPWDDFVNQGNAWSDLGEFDKALQSYDQAFAVKPNYHEAYYNRGIVFERQKQFDKARAEFIKAYDNGLRSRQLYDRFLAHGLVSKKTAD
jgi:tetratricopeptide (TPR) repeat protein